LYFQKSARADPGTNPQQNGAAEAHVLNPHDLRERPRIPVDSPNMYWEFNPKALFFAPFGL
jgi:hypothetical protein